MKRIVIDRMWLNPEEFKGPALYRRLSRSFEEFELQRDEILDDPHAVPVIVWMSDQILRYGESDRLCIAPVVLMHQDQWEVGYVLCASPNDAKFDNRMVIKRFGHLAGEIAPGWDQYVQETLKNVPAFAGNNLHTQEPEA